MAKQIKESNDLKAQENKEAEERRRAELEEAEKQLRENELVRQVALSDARKQGEGLIVDNADKGVDEDNTFDESMDVELLLPPLSQRREGRRKGVQAGSGIEDQGGGGGEDDRGGGDGGGWGNVPVVKKLIVHNIDPALRNNSGRDLLPRLVHPMAGRSFILDMSLERVFGQGATRLAIEFDGMSAESADHNISDCSSTDMDVPGPSSSTPGRGVSGMKRYRDGLEVNFGDLSSITNEGDLQGGFSSGEESDEGNDDGSKKLRIEGGSDSGQKTSSEGSNEETENDRMGEDGSQLGSGSEQVQDPPPEVDPEPSVNVSEQEQVPDETC